MKLWLVDIDLDLLSAWEQSFADFENVTIVEGDILSLAECAIVSPANSYGFMDGGIDRLYGEFFGPTLEQKIQEAISRRPEGYLPIGSAEITKTNNRRIPYVISAPTMVTPEVIPPENCFYAMIAILKVSSQHTILRTKLSSNETYL